jgi:hypothetical protein
MVDILWNVFVIAAVLCLGAGVALLALFVGVLLLLNQQSRD